MIETDGLEKDFGAFTAVRGLDLQVGQGELFGLLGPNGAGKTTTLRMLTGVLRPSRGTARVAGFDVVEREFEVKRRVGYVADPPFLYDRLSGLEYIRFLAGLWGHDPAATVERAGRYLRLLGLEERAGHRVESYSHGMRRKLALASVLAREPAVLFLDEPTSGLDPRAARAVKDLLGELTEGGVTVLFSTHVMEIAEAICHRVGIIHEGDLVAVGDMEALRRQARAGAPGGPPQEPRPEEETGGSATLEEIFLQVTGGEEAEDLGRALESGH